jgi:cathepsin B
MNQQIQISQKPPSNLSKFKWEIHNKIQLSRINNIMQTSLLYFILMGLVLSNMKWKTYDDVLAFVESQNSKGANHWKANANNGLNLETISQLAGTSIDVNDPRLKNWIQEKDDKSKSHKRLLQSTVTSFDLRSVYPKCSSLQTIRNQGVCGSCWAVASMTSLDDNYCMKFSNSTYTAQRTFSYEDLLECCPTSVCASANGCNGGSPISAFSYVQSTGVSSGDQFGSNALCKPYFLNPNLYTTTVATPPTCQNSCASTSSYTTPYASDKFKIASNSYLYYPLVTNMVALMQQKLQSGIVLVAYMDVYYDFYAYSSGVYVPTSTTLLGGHAVRIIGWGVSGTQKYWIVANQWGTGWGMNGYFWIAAGTGGQGTCRIEMLLMYGNF